LPARAARSDAPRIDVADEPIRVTVLALPPEDSKILTSHKREFAHVFR
jgi:hypothetical protein